MTDTWTPSSLEELDGLKVMQATLDSGARVLAGTVTLDELIALDAFPDDLVYIAVLEHAGATLPEMARELRDGGENGADRVKEMSRDLLKLRDRLCLLSLQKGGYQDGDAELVFERLDSYDRAYVADLAQRRVVVDAAGRRFGAQPLSHFRDDAEEPAGDPAGEVRPGEGVDVPEAQL